MTKAAACAVILTIPALSAARSEKHNGGRPSPACRVGVAPARTSGVVSVWADEGGARVIAAASGAVTLDANRLRVPLAPAATATAGDKNLRSLLSALKPGKRIHLVIGGLSAKRQPDMLYEVYFDLPPEAEIGVNDPHYVGTINFFNAVRRGALKFPAAADARFFSFDITETLKKLQARKILSEKATITIRPSGPPAAGSEPTIGRIELIEQ